MEGGGLFLVKTNRPGLTVAFVAFPAAQSTPRQSAPVDRGSAPRSRWRGLGWGGAEGLPLKWKGKPPTIQPVGSGRR
jgi:hypothetical protein